MGRPARGHRAASPALLSPRGAGLAGALKRGADGGTRLSRSSEKALGGQGGGGDLYSENITRILDKLLDGYDNRLRPGFGGRGGNSRPVGAVGERVGSWAAGCSRAG